MRPLVIAITLVSLIAAGFGAPAALLDDRQASAASDQASADGANMSPSMTRSSIEDATGVHYQHDGGVAGDAPDHCADVDDRRTLDAFGNETQGILVQEDDESDVFYAPIPVNLTGQRMVFQLGASVGFEMYGISFDILSGDCGFSVFDEDADIYRPERNVPAEPFTAKPAHQTYEYAADADHACDDSEWKFMIKHKRGANPSSLYVEWSNGDYTYIANNDIDPSQVAKYVTSFNLEHTIARLAVQMPAGFDGELTVAHGPCDVRDGRQDFQAPTADATSGEFTVVRPGDYVLRVWISRDAVEHAQDRINQTRNTDVQGALNGQKDCHTRYCQPAFILMGFSATLQPQDSITA